MPPRTFPPTRYGIWCGILGTPRWAAWGGEPRFRLPQQTTVGAEVSLFWRYEQFLRRKESEFNTLIGVSGCVFAMRRELAEPLRDDLIEDFVYPLKVASKGYRVVYEKEAGAYEETTLTGDQEFQRKTRIVVGGINALWHMRSLLNPFRHPLLTFQLFSHKICRWLTPFFLATLFISTMVLIFRDPLFMPLGTAMIAFAACSGIGSWFHTRRSLPRLFKVPYYFVLINLAVLAGIYQYIAGERRVIWEPIRS